MSTAAVTYVPINRLEIGERTIIPAFGLSADIGNWGIRPVGNKGEQNYRAFPTLAQIHHAFETDKVIKGNTLSHRYKGEHTATFLRNGKQIVTMPEKVYLDENGLWVAEGGKVTDVELQPEGWVTEYDKPTGFPSKMSKNRADAVKTFGDDASSFWYATDGLYAVGRAFDQPKEDCRFNVYAIWRPDGGPDGFGSRSVQGSLVLPVIEETAEVVAFVGDYERGRNDTLREVAINLETLPKPDFLRKYRPQ